MTKLRNGTTSKNRTPLNDAVHVCLAGIKPVERSDSTEGAERSDTGEHTWAKVSERSDDTEKRETSGI